MAYNNVLPAWLYLPDDHPEFIKRMEEIKKGKKMNDKTEGTVGALDGDPAERTITVADIEGLVGKQAFTIEQPVEAIGEETNETVIPVEDFR